MRAEDDRHVDEAGAFFAPPGMPSLGRAILAEIAPAIAEMKTREEFVSGTRDFQQTFSRQIQDAIDAVTESWSRSLGALAGGRENASYGVGLYMNNETPAEQLAMVKACLVVSDRVIVHSPMLVDALSHPTGSAAYDSLPFLSLTDRQRAEFLEIASLPHVAFDETALKRPVNDDFIARALEEGDALELGEDVSDDPDGMKRRVFLRLDHGINLGIHVTVVSVAARHPNAIVGYEAEQAIPVDSSQPRYSIVDWTLGPGTDSPFGDALTLAHHFVLAALPRCESYPLDLLLELVGELEESLSSYRRKVADLRIEAVGYGQQDPTDAFMTMVGRTLEREYADLKANLESRRRWQAARDTLPGLTASGVALFPVLVAAPNWEARIALASAETLGVTLATAWRAWKESRFRSQAAKRHPMYWAYRFLSESGYPDDDVVS